MSLARLLLTGASRFDPRSLFGSGAVGWAHWYDSPSLYSGGNHPYLYQDSAGTTPATAVGQSVGLVLDRRFNGMRGPELFPSLNFSTGVVTGSVTGTTANTFTTSGPGGLRFAGLVSVGKMYDVRITGTVSAGTFYFRNPSNLTNSASGTGTFTINARLVWSTTAEVYFQNDSAATTTITSISVREIPGTHRIQTSAPSRPLLMARVNQLLASEDFSSASWTKGAQASFTANQAVAPNGTTTADLWTALSGGNNTVSQAITVAASTQHRGSLRIKYVSGSPWVRVMFYDGGALNQNRIWVNVQTGAEGTKEGIGTATFTSASASMGSDGWVTVTVNGAIATTAGSLAFVCQSADNTTVQAAGSFYIWGADLRTADDAAKNLPAYQRVGATAADHDTDGFPHYLLYDGTDDSYASTATVDGSGSDKVTVVTGVTKLSDAAAAIVLEHTTTVASNNGAFYLAAPPSAAANYGSASKGTVLATVNSASNYAAPNTAVLGLVSDIGADLVSVRVNGTTVGTTTGDQGTGNYANATLYFGSRGGSSVRLNGREYASIGRFGPMSETERNRLEQWTKNLMRMP